MKRPVTGSRILVKIIDIIIITQDVKLGDIYINKRNI